MKQNSALAQFLLQLQCVHVRKTQLHGGLAWRALIDGAKGGENGGHSRRRENHVVLGAVVEAGELADQRAAHAGGVGSIAATREVRLGLTRRNYEAGMLPESSERGSSGCAGDDAVKTLLGNEFGRLAALAANEFRAHPGRA